MNQKRIFFITSWVNYVVEAVPPISDVLILPSFNTFFKASPIASANKGKLRYLNIIAELRIIEVGLTTFFPAILIPVLGKALVQYFEVENEEKEAKYLTFTNKYQIAALVKNQDKDAEAIEIADFFDKSRDQITLEVSYK